MSQTKSEIAEQLIKQAIQRRIESGMFRKDESVVTDCPHQCGRPVVTEPAHCWGREVPGYFAIAWHDHGEGFFGGEDKPVIDEIKRIADFVVLCGGHSCFITAHEREQYLNAVGQGAKIIEIRGYVFDRVYPIVPYKEWVEDQRRHKRTVMDKTVID